LEVQHFREGVLAEFALEAPFESGAAVSYNLLRVQTDLLECVDVVTKILERHGLHADLRLMVEPVHKFLMRGSDPDVESVTTVESLDCPGYRRRNMGILAD
jgi:hypothetical protein